MPPAVAGVNGRPPRAQPHWVLLGSVSSSGLSLPSQRIGVRLWRAQATLAGAFGPPVHLTMLTVPLREPTSVAVASISGSLAWPLSAEPLLVSTCVKPPLNVASSRLR